MLRAGATPRAMATPRGHWLADVVDMSSYHFALFNGSTGVPPHRFVLRQRIANACRVLATPELVRNGLGGTPETCPAPAVQEVPAGREGG